MIKLRRGVGHAMLLYFLHFLFKILTALSLVQILFMQGSSVVCIKHRSELSEALCTSRCVCHRL